MKAKFLVEFIFDNPDQSAELNAKTVELPLNITEFCAALLELELEVWLEHQGADTVSVSMIIAEEPIPNYGIEAGDVVYYLWDWGRLNGAGLSEAAQDIIKKFKPLWSQYSGMVDFNYFTTNYNLLDVMPKEYERIVSYARERQLAAG